MPLANRKFALLLLAAWSLPEFCSAKEPAAQRKEEPQSFTQVDGKQFVFANEDVLATVIVFFGHDCSISNGYVPEIKRLVTEFAKQKIRFCIVYADADMDAKDAALHAKEYELPCAAILDPSLSQAKKWGARIKPEVAVISPKDELLYLGRIDDLYVDFGKKQTAPKQRELRDCLTAIAAGKSVKVTRTKAIGCDIYFPK